MRKRTNARVARNAERCPGMSFMVEKSHPDFVLWRPDAAFLFRVAADESVHPERRRTFGCRHGRGIMTGQFARTPAPSVGVDVVPTDRVRDLLESSDRTVERILTEDRSRSARTTSGNWISTPSPVGSPRKKPRSRPCTGGVRCRGGAYGSERNQLDGRRSSSPGRWRAVPTGAFRRRP